jgi:hypothetical protein
MDHPCRLVVEDFVETKCSPELFLRVCSEDRTALERVGYVVWRFFSYCRFPKTAAALLGYATPQNPNVEENQIWIPAGSETCSVGCDKQKLPNKKDGPLVARGVPTSSGRSTKTLASATPPIVVSVTPSKSNFQRR